MHTTSATEEQIFDNTIDYYRDMGLYVDASQDRVRWYGNFPGESSPRSVPISSSPVLTSGAYSPLDVIARGLINSLVDYIHISAANSVTVENGLSAYSTSANTTIGIFFDPDNLKINPIGQITTIQDISVTSTPTFDSIYLSNLTNGKIVIVSGGKLITSAINSVSNQNHSILSNLDSDDHIQYIVNNPITDERNVITGDNIKLLTLVTHPSQTKNPFDILDSTSNVLFSVSANGDVQVLGNLSISGTSKNINFTDPSSHEISSVGPLRISSQTMSLDTTSAGIILRPQGTDTLIVYPNSVSAVNALVVEPSNVKVIYLSGSDNRLVYADPTGKLEVMNFIKWNSTDFYFPTLSGVNERYLVVGNDGIVRAVSGSSASVSGSGSGTIGTISKFITSATVGNSIITESGSLITVNGNLKVGTVSGILSGANGLIVSAPIIPVADGGTNNNSFNGTYFLWYNGSSLVSSPFTSGSFLTSANGTPGTISKFITKNSIGDSIIKDSGTKITIAGGLSATGDFNVLSLSGSTTRIATINSSGKLETSVILTSIVSGTGSLGKIPIWTGPNSLGNSILSGSGNNISVSGNFRIPNLEPNGVVFIGPLGQLSATSKVVYDGTNFNIFTNANINSIATFAFANAGTTLLGGPTVLSQGLNVSGISNFGGVVKTGATTVNGVLTDRGYLHVGPSGGFQIQIDDDEIQAMSATTPGPLYLNKWGSSVRIATSGSALTPGYGVIIGENHTPQAMLDVRSKLVGGVIASFGETTNTSPFSASIGYTFITGNSLNFMYNYDTDDANGFINYYGYRNAHSRFRDLYISDGKAGTLAFFDGSTHRVIINNIAIDDGFGQLQVKGSIVGTSFYTSASSKYTSASYNAKIQGGSTQPYFVGVSAVGNTANNRVDYSLSPFGFNVAPISYFAERIYARSSLNVSGITTVKTLAGTSTRFVTVDSNGILSSSLSVTVYTSGSGINNNIVKWTGTNSQGTSNIYDTGSLVSISGPISANGLISADGGIYFPIAGSQQQGKIGRTSVEGLLIRAIAGSTNDFTIYSNDAGTLIANPTGTRNLTVGHSSGILTVPGFTILSSNLNVSGTSTFKTLAGTSTRFVTVDSNGILSSSLSISNFTSGSGTFGRIPIWSSTNTLSNSIMYGNSSLISVAGNLSASGNVSASGSLFLKDTSVINIGLVNLYNLFGSALRTDNSFSIGGAASVGGTFGVTGAGSIGGPLTLSNSTAASDTLRLTSTTAGNGLTIGGDTNLYRSASNHLRTNDDFTVDGIFRGNSDWVYSQNSHVIRADSNDGSDSKRVFLSGGGAVGTGRGAHVQLNGNEYSGDNGSAYLEAGNISGAKIGLYTQALGRFWVHYDGTVSVNSSALSDGAGRFIVDGKIGGTNFYTNASQTTAQYNAEASATTYFSALDGGTALVALHPSYNYLVRNLCLGDSYQTTHLLHLKKPDSSQWLSFDRTSNTYEQGFRFETNGSTDWYLFEENGGSHLQIQKSGESDSTPRMRFRGDNSDIETNLGGGTFKVTGNFNAQGGLVRTSSNFVNGSSTDSGYLIIGSSGSTQVQIDNDEIQSMNNNSPSAFYINASGGNIHVGNHGDGPYTSSGNTYIRRAIIPYIASESGPSTFISNPVGGMIVLQSYGEGIHRLWTFGNTGWRYINVDG